MKKLFSLFLMLFGIGFSIHAQDVIVKKDGSTVLCKIVQVTPTEVIYLKWSDMNGPQYIMDSSLISNINYMDGKQDKLNEQSTNSYAPGIQQSGEAQYNDKALLHMDKIREYGDYNILLKKSKKMSTIAWAVGGGGIVLGGILVLCSSDIFYANGAMLITGGVLMIGGAGTLVGCLIKSNILKNKAKELSFATVYQKEINLGNKLLLSAGIDVIHNKSSHEVIPGLGLQFNF